MALSQTLIYVLILTWPTLSVPLTVVNLCSGISTRESAMEQDLSPSHTRTLSTQIALFVPSYLKAALVSELHSVIELIHKWLHSLFVIPFSTNRTDKLIAGV